jgi:hypothetical protein
MISSLSPRTRRIVAVLAIATFVGALGAKLNTSGNLEVAGATVNVMIDDPGRSIVDRRAAFDEVQTLQKRAELYGRLMVSAPVLADVARRAGLAPEQLSGVARSPGVPYSFTQPDSEQRATQIVQSRATYRLEMQARQNEPILSIYSQAPSLPEAKHLAAAAALGLHDYLRSLARQERFAERDLPTLRQLGPPTGGVISGRARLIIGAVTFITAFALTCAILFGLVYLRTRRTRLAATAPDRTPAPDEEPGLDDWPHTTRALPWMIAGFIGMLWLVPFDKIELAFSTPIDMKLDRIVLPFIFGVWILAFASGPKLAPRLRLTPIHVALGMFLACAFLSVVLNARYLNHTLELELALKKLPLLISYMSIFVIVASGVRRTEIRAFMTYSLVLAVICAVGIIWEFRFQTNLFNVWTARLLPPGFSFDGNPTGAEDVDSLGRLGIVGPAQVGLEAVSILAMALPIAVVGVLGTKQRRQRVLYGLAVCLLFAATFATVRKSAMLAPISVFATLAYFRRRELLSLAPLGVIVAVVVSVLSPGAVHQTIAQFVEPNSANAATTRDRVSDYDAIRPDLWTHLLFGRGFGSYDHDTYRVLDSEVLGRVVETGIVGLLVFLLIGVSVVFATRKTISSRAGPYSGLALIGAAAAVCFVVISTLFDVMAYPHVTYVFLYIAGLAAVAVQPPAEADRPRPRPEHGVRRHSAKRKSPALRGVH